MSKIPLKPLIPVAKTIKLFIGGEFPRTESGRSYKVSDLKTPQNSIHLCLASRKDLRNSVEVAKNSLKSWKQKSAFNRSQILYRMAEIAEGRKGDFLQLLQDYFGAKPDEAIACFETLIEAWVYYAGFCDKIDQSLSSANPVGSPFQNTTSVDALGVVAIIGDEKTEVAHLLAGLAAVIAPGNTAILIVPGKLGIFAGWLGEIIATADVPKGAINILSGDLGELLPHLGSHMEIDGLASFVQDTAANSSLRSASVSNLKRMHIFDKKHTLGMTSILPFLEFKTLWVTQGF